jgi:hypothetical protein
MKILHPMWADRPKDVNRLDFHVEIVDVLFPHSLALAEFQKSFVIVQYSSVDDNPYFSFTLDVPFERASLQDMYCG